jgi:hypothetical protein
MGRRAGVWVTVALWDAMVAGFVGLGVALLSEKRNGFVEAPGAEGPSSRAAARVWEFADDFARRDGSLRNPGRDRYGNTGVWRYMAGPSARAREPSSFELLGSRRVGLLGARGFDAWIGPDGDDGGVSFPIVGVRGRAPEGFAHPSERRSAIVAWTSPIQGRVRISGAVGDGDPRGGDGVGWVFRKGRRTLAAGTLRNGAARAPFGVSSVAVDAGEMLYLKIAPRRSSGYDSTMFSLRIDERQPAGASAT